MPYFQEALGNDPALSEITHLFGGFASPLNPSGHQYLNIRGSGIDFVGLVGQLGCATALFYVARILPSVSIKIFAPDGIILFRYEFPHAVLDCYCPACDSVFTKSC